MHWIGHKCITPFKYNFGQSKLKQNWIRGHSSRLYLSAKMSRSLSIRKCLIIHNNHIIICMYQITLRKRAICATKWEFYFGWSLAKARVQIHIPIFNVFTATCRELVFHLKNYCKEAVSIWFQHNNDYIIQIKKKTKWGDELVFKKLLGKC